MDYICSFCQIPCTSIFYLAQRYSKCLNLQMPVHCSCMWRDLHSLALRQQFSVRFSSRSSVAVFFILTMSFFHVVCSTSVMEYPWHRGLSPPNIFLISHWLCIPSGIFPMCAREHFRIPRKAHFDIRQWSSVIPDILAGFALILIRQCF